jgi:SEC-C motif-containing protein
MSGGNGNGGNGKPEPCPCGRRDRRDFPVAYAMCCGRYLDGAAMSAAVADMNGSPAAPGATSAGFAPAPAPDAESLMRSRYTAFVRERADYLLATWHASTRPASIEFEPGIKWLGLDVRSRSVLDADHAEVEFVARHRDATGVAARLHERSRFVREGDEEAGEVARWFYVDGEMK